eukprot:Clim_evm216s157 gene=Clim_evmTU216s157
MKVLCTGGAGYIGTHTVVELYNSGHEAVIVDDLSNSCVEAVKRVEKIVGKDIPFYEANLLEGDKLDKIFAEHKIDAVIHFAGLKAVGESSEIPLTYYKQNISGTISLLEAMDRANVTNLVFSSSATVYGLLQYLPVTEDHPLSATNPYGRTKLFIEDILRDYVASRPGKFNAILLRYFNPVGAHASGTIGEDPQGIPNNLMPFVMQVAVGRREKLSVFGGDYDTKDGTGVRDFIHVVDLAKGHVASLNKLAENPGCPVYNLGTGTGYSVLEMVAAAEKVSGKKIAYQIVDRRPGDIGTVYADPAFAEKELGWKAELGVEEMCGDMWKWQSENPTGFKN